MTTFDPRRGLGILLGKRSSPSPHNESVPHLGRLLLRPSRPSARAPPGSTVTPLCFAGSVPAAAAAAAGEKGQGRDESFCEAPCPCLVCTPRTPGPERASFLQLLRQQAVPRAQGREFSGRDGNHPRVSQLQGSGERGWPCLGKWLPQNAQL